MGPRLWITHILMSYPIIAGVMWLDSRGADDRRWSRRGHAGGTGAGRAGHVLGPGGPDRYVGWFIWLSMVGSGGVCRGTPR